MVGGELIELLLVFVASEDGTRSVRIWRQVRRGLTGY